MSYLTLNSIKKKYSDLAVIRTISLSIEQGEFVVFVGPSGCGKSTLLRLIAGLEDLDAGSITLDGQDITNVASSKRDMAMVFQSYALYPHMTVANNLSFALRQAGLPKTEIKRKIDKVAATLELTPYLERKPGVLSGGQRQRVAIGRAIVRNPKAFLFDEPLSNLDAALRVDMRLEIARLHRNLGATTIYVTHDQVEAMTLADKVVVLNRGVIEQAGAPVDLYENPKNLFVAKFIGTPRMSFIPSRVVSVNELSTTLESEQGASITLGPTPLAPNDYIQIGIRPEHLILDNPENADHQGDIELVEKLGSDTFCYIDSQLGRLTARLPGNVRVNPGETVGLHLKDKSLHIFKEHR